LIGRKKIELRQRKNEGKLRKKLMKREGEKEEGLEQIEAYL
jgi:hypothetical protein